MIIIQKQIVLQWVGSNSIELKFSVLWLSGLALLKMSILPCTCTWMQWDLFVYCYDWKESLQSVTLGKVRL